VLSLVDAENLLMAFSEIFQTNETFAIVRRQPNVVVIKNGNGMETLVSRFKELTDQSEAHAQLTLGNANYFCSLGANSVSILSKLLNKHEAPPKKIKTLRLSFQEGAPPSLNPHLSSGDMRCRLLSKLLFEGLTRLNEQGEPEPAGATEWSLSNDSLIYTFKLRSCYWSNGEKVTAIDYVA
jgi:MarR-like DNA-binding transcriptional regulator SgrR of sgrS sRNA